MCHCRAITDRDIRAEVARGAHCVDDVTAACGAGEECGGCRSLVADTILDEIMREQGAAARGDAPVRLRLVVPA